MNELLGGIGMIACYLVLMAILCSAKDSHTKI